MSNPPPENFVEFLAISSFISDIVKFISDWKKESNHRLKLLVHEWDFKNGKMRLCFSKAIAGSMSEPTEIWLLAAVNYICSLRRFVFLQIKLRNKITSINSDPSAFLVKKKKSQMRIKCSTNNEARDKHSHALYSFIISGFCILQVRRWVFY